MTTSEFAERNLRKAKEALVNAELKPNKTDDEIKNICEKVMHWKEICALLGGANNA